MKHVIEDLIVCITIVVNGVKDKGNKPITPPNKNFQIFTNHFPSHSTNVVELKGPGLIVASDMSTKANNVVNLMRNLSLSVTLASSFTQGISLMHLIDHYRLL